MPDRIDRVTLPAADVPSDDELSRALGPRFLAYVCTASEEEIVRRLDRGLRLPPLQEEVLRETLRVAGLLAAQRQPMTINNRPGLESLSDSFARFGEVVPDGETSIANTLRAAAGGSLPELASDDPIKAAIGRIARDWYPVLLVPPDEGQLGYARYGLRFGAIAWHHPGLRAFVDALNRSEEPLRQLFGDADIDELTNSRWFTSSSGSGGAVQVATLVSNVCTNAEMRAHLQGELSPEVYLREIEKQVDELRSLASGSTVSLLAAVGFSPASAPEEFRLTTPWGDVVAATRWHRELTPAGADLVLLTDYPVKLDLHDSFDPAADQGPDQAFLNAYAGFEQRIDLLRIAFTLALDRDWPVALAPTWRFIADPTMIGGFNWSPESRLGATAELTQDDAQNVEYWAQLVEQQFHPSLKLAIRRTLGAIALRSDPADGLVDAVIALENLFGTGQSEVGFRLSAALAWFLESDAESRVARQKAVARLYGLRSKIVHGGEVDIATLNGDRIAATKLAVESLRKLFSQRPDLIPAGDQRGKLVILRGME